MVFSLSYQDFSGFISYDIPVFANDTGGLVEPTTDGNTIAIPDGIFGPNFQFDAISEPIPALFPLGLVLLVLGMMGLFIMVRRTNAV